MSDRGCGSRRTVFPDTGGVTASAAPAVRTAMRPTFQSSRSHTPPNPQTALPNGSLDDTPFALAFPTSLPPVLPFSPDGVSSRLQRRGVEAVGPGGHATVSRRRALQLGAAAVPAVLIGDALVGGVEALAAGAAAPSAKQDAVILGFGLLIEELQAAFYDAALDRAGLKGELRQFAEVVGGHEHEHVTFVRGALGPKAPKTPRFAFGAAVRTPKRFADTAVALEDLGVAAYNGAAPSLTPGALAAAARLVSVEARHAAWIRDLTGRNPAPRAADLPMAAAAVTAALNRTHFVRTR